MFTFRKHVRHRLVAVCLPIYAVAAAQAQQPDPAKLAIEQLQDEIDELRAEICELKSHSFLSSPVKINRLTRTAGSLAKFCQVTGVSYV